MTPAIADVLATLPSGVVVVDNDGGILLANPGAERLLGRVVGRRCCDVLRCGTDQGPFAGRCVTEYMRERGAPDGETRIDLPPGLPAGAVWLTAAVLGDGTGFVFHLRAGARHDRRRRNAMPLGDPSILFVETLGRTRVHRGDQDLAGKWLAHRPGQILKYLAGRRGETATIDEIASALWPEQLDTSPGAIRHFVHVLRERLEPGRERNAESSFVVGGRGGYALDTQRVHLDTGRFEQHLRTGAAAFLSGEAAIAAPALEYALDLYAGDFLEDEPYAEWALVERERLRRLASEGCRMLTQLALDKGDLDRAIVHAERLGDIEPLDEEVQRTLILLLLRAGRRTSATHRFERMRAETLKQFGDVPSFELRELAATAASGPVRVV